LTFNNVIASHRRDGNGPEQRIWTLVALLLLAELSLLFFGFIPRP
jgi:hypothetical protein